MYFYFITMAFKPKLKGQEESDWKLHNFWYAKDTDKLSRNDVFTISEMGSAHFVKDEGINVDDLESLKPVMVSMSCLGNMTKDEFFHETKEVARDN
jgi:hypothetical protein